MKKIIALCSVLLTSLVPLSPAGPDQAETVAGNDVLVMESMETLQGSITAVNVAKKTIEVRWESDVINMIFQNITLKITPNTALIKNGETIEMNDIEVGDHATIRYAPNAVPLAQAMSVDIEE